MHKRFYRDCIRQHIIFLDPNEIVRHLTVSQFLEVKHTRIPPVTLKAWTKDIDRRAEFLASMTGRSLESARKIAILGARMSSAYAV